MPTTSPIMPEVLITHGLHFPTFQGPGGLTVEAELTGNGFGGDHMVASNHDRADAGPGASPDGLGRFSSRRIDNGGQAGEGYPVSQFFGNTIKGNARGQLLPAHGQHAQPFPGQLVSRGHDFGIPAFHLGTFQGTDIQDLLRAALKKDHMATLMLVQTGHVAPMRFERDDGYCGPDRVFLFSVKTGLGRGHDERSLGRVTLDYLAFFTPFNS